MLVRYRDAARCEQATLKSSPNLIGNSLVAYAKALYNKELRCRGPRVEAKPTTPGACHVEALAA